MRQKTEENGLKKAKIAVERLLKIRLRSEKEIVDKLRLKNIPGVIIIQVIKDYKDLDLINDQIFAAAWIRSRLKKPFGPNRIRRELYQKGIEKEIIEDSLKMATHDDYSEFNMVLALARHKWEKYKDVEDKKKKQRVYGFLIRRGFQPSTIIKALNVL